MNLRWNLIFDTSVTHEKGSTLTKPIQISLLLTLAIVGLWGDQSRSTLAQTPANELEANQAETNPGDVVRLEIQLVNGLRVVTAEQRHYINQVVALVNQGKLPRAMVNVIYQ